MFEIDKMQFGSFLSARRKEKNLTQKQLAEKLFISDKAVSKWERGISLPDISLLIPLADILGITVTELLEGKLLENTAEADTQQIEKLVKKALAFSERQPEKSKEEKKRLWLCYGACILVVLAEWLLFYLLGIGFMELIGNGLLAMQVLSLVFGAYFWIRAKEQLPGYYDENRISYYNDGFFEMNFPGICFNNRNWPHILRFCRLWCLFDSAVYPLFHIFICRILPDAWNQIAGTCLLLLVSLGGLFAPIYRIAKKYE